MDNTRDCRHTTSPDSSHIVAFSGKKKDEGTPVVGRKGILAFSYCFLSPTGHAGGESKQVRNNAYILIMHIIPHPPFKAFFSPAFGKKGRELDRKWEFSSNFKIRHFLKHF